MNGFYKFAMNVMRVIMPLWYRIETYGTENLPEDSGYLFVSNHRSMADPILIGVQNPDTQFCFLAKQELFSAGLVGWLLRKLGAIAVDRGSGDTTALEEIEYRLQNGENALIFPEGTRSKDGKLGHFKTGAALIAAQTGVPVVPVAISFDDEELHFRSTICVRYGEPFRIPQTDASNPSAAVLKQVRQEMTKNVSALLEMNTEAADDSTAEKAEKKESEVTERTMSKNNNNHQNNHNNKKKKPAPEKEALKKIEEEIADEAEEIVDDVEDVIDEAEDEIEDAAEEILDDTGDDAEADDADADDDEVIAEDADGEDDADDAEDDADAEDDEEAEPVDEDDFVSEEDDAEDEDDEDDDDDDEDDDAPALPFKFSNPFKKLLKKDSVDDEDFDDDEDDEDDDEDEDDDLTEDDADLDDDDDDDEDDNSEKPALFGGFSLKNAFKKKPAAESDDLELDSDFDDDFEDYDEESAEGDDDDEYDDDDDEVVAAKGVDYGRIALILTFVILAIFAIDFFRRLVNDWKSTQGMLDIQSQASSMVESMSGDSDAELTPAMTTAPENPENASTVATTTEGAAVETTTTTTAFVDDRETQTVSVDTKALHSGSLVLIDSTHQQIDAPNLVTFASFEPQHLRLVSTNMQVDGSLAAPITNWFNDFYANTGLGNIMVYNTIDTPAYPPYSTAIPERSTGLTLDLAILNEAAQSHSPYTPDGTYAWLTEHAADYGFIVRYPAGKNDKTGLDGMTWHFRYVGAPHAKYMYDNDLCLEEYLLLLQDHTWDSEHLTTTVNETEYEIYYVPASETEDTTEIKYPISTTGAQPIISGDNNSGFVVAMPKE